MLASDPHGDRSYADTQISTHASASDPHGDRSYAASVAADAEVAAKNYADLLVASALSLRGGYDASSNAWPTAGGSGPAGAIKAGNLWFVSTPGVLAGKSVVVGDAFFAVFDAPGQTNANWCVLDTNLGFVPETSGAATAAITAHLLASDPHGDRNYADTLADMRLRFDAAQALTAAQALQARQNLKIYRSTASVTTTSLSPQATESGIVTMARAFTVLKITTDYPARVRLYDTVAHRDADVNRAVGIYPSDSSGCLFEFITTASLLTAPIIRPVNGFNAEATVSSSIAYNITNMDGSTRAITATLAFLPTE